MEFSTSLIGSLSRFSLGVEVPLPPLARDVRQALVIDARPIPVFGIPDVLVRAFDAGDDEPIGFGPIFRPESLNPFPLSEHPDEVVGNATPESV
jgi:hypothetical protein